MPVSRLDALCQRTLGEIVNISHQIRCSALAYASNQNSGPIQLQEFRRQLETIRTFSDTILEAITLDPCTIDDRITDWLFSGEPRSCLAKLKEMDGMLKQADGQVRPALALARPLRPTEDRLAVAMTFFDKHKSLFHFLLTPDVWWVFSNLLNAWLILLSRDQQRLLHQPSEAAQIDNLPIVEETQDDPLETRTTRSGMYVS